MGYIGCELVQCRTGTRAHFQCVLHSLTAGRAKSVTFVPIAANILHSNFKGDFSRPFLLCFQLARIPCLCVWLLFRAGHCVANMGTDSVSNQRCVDARELLPNTFADISSRIHRGVYPRLVYCCRTLRRQLRTLMSSRLLSQPLKYADC